MTTLLYKEVQSEGFPMLSYIFAGVLFVLIVFFVIKTKRILHKIMLSTIALFFIPIILIFGCLRLVTLYYPDKIEYQFLSILPPNYEIVSKDSIVNLRIIDTSPGTAGVRTMEKGDIYKVFSHKAILITLINGNTIGLGTKHPDEIRKALSAYYTFVK